MSLESPNLDVRTFAEMMQEARQQIARSCPQWTDLSPHDPGIMLLEVFAHLTESLIYQFNRIPQKAYVEFLRLIGVSLRPPVAAATQLEFSLARPKTQRLSIPERTLVAVSRASGDSDAPVFVTSREVHIEPGETSVRVLAHHCEFLTEVLGTSSGLPAQSFRVSRPPIVAPLPDRLDLVVGVEMQADERADGRAAREQDGVFYELWEEVEGFANLSPDARSFMVDRASGTLTFAPSLRRELDDQRLEAVPAALAGVPRAGREIRVWYRRGGGARGNVAALALDTIKSQVPAGLEVNNPIAASGGADVESLDNALLRGPQQIHSLNRAVTARDFELLAVRRTGSVARARALTQAAIWKHGRPGTVEVLLVPSLAASERTGSKVSLEQLLDAQGRAETALESVRSDLDARRPLGTHCVVSWTHYKRVHVRAQVAIHRAEDKAAVEARVLDRLHRSINPLPDAAGYEGWSFGASLRASHVYATAIAEPGVRWVGSVKLAVDSVPDREVRSLRQDSHQPNTWYAESGGDLFRTQDAGEGWEALLHVENETLVRLEPHPDTPGGLALITHTRSDDAEGTNDAGDEAGSRVYVSWDCGETCTPILSTAWKLRDVAWLRRDDGVQLLFLAGDEGLHRIEARSSASIEPIAVLPDGERIGLWAVAIGRDRAGRIHVSVAAQQERGIFSSHREGLPRTFRPLPSVEGTDIRVLEFRSEPSGDFLWLGSSAFSTSRARGCARWRLLGADDPPEGWVKLDQDWNDAGSCNALAFDADYVYAATALGGLLRLDPSAESEHWEAPSIDCGLPLSPDGRLVEVRSVGVDPIRHTVLVGCDAGVFRSQDTAKSFASASARIFDDKVTVPDNWLLCSGEHEIDVIYEDEA